MKAKLEFDLDDREDRMKFHAATNSEHLVAAIWQAKHNLFNLLCTDDKSEDYCDGVGDAIREILEDIPVDVDLMTE